MNAAHVARTEPLARVSTAFFHFHRQTEALQGRPPTGFDAMCLDLFDELEEPNCHAWASDAHHGCLETADFPEGFALRNGTPEAQSLAHSLPD